MLHSSLDAPSYGRELHVQDFDAVAHRKISQMLVARRTYGGRTFLPLPFVTRGGTIVGF